MQRFWTVRFSIKFLLLAFASSFLAAMIVHPTLLLFRQFCVLYQHDTVIPLQNCFNLVSQFHQGGIQLWDRYDHFNLAYTQLTSGIYTFSNLITAGIYILFSWVCKCPGEAMLNFYTIVWHGSNILLRTVGGFLLLSQFTRKPWVILFSLICLNTLLTSELYQGLLTNNLYSYLPLLLYFILRFFNTLKLNDFLAMLVVGTIAVVNSPLFALGYFYLIVHFFLIACIAYAWLNRKSEEKTLSQPVQSQWLKKALKISAVLVFCFFTMLPNFYWAQSLKKDFFIPDSGLHATEGRMKKAFNPQACLQDPTAGYAPVETFFERSLDFSENQMPSSWIFIGASTLLLSFLGLIYGKDKRKFIFLATILLVFFVNVSKQAPPLFLFAHYLNVYTNPFAFLVRSFHMSALLMPVLFLPLVAMGLESIDDLLETKEERFQKKTPLYGIGALLCSMICFSLMSASYLAKSYSIGITLLFLILFYLLWKRSDLSFLYNKKMRWYELSNKFVHCCLAVVLLIELAALSNYLKSDTFNNIKIGSIRRKIAGLDSQFVLDYQNPEILPLREFYSVGHENWGFNDQTHYGLFFQFTPFERFKNKPNIYTQRHIAYKDIHLDPDIFSEDKKKIFTFVSESKEQSSPHFIEEEFTLSEAEVHNNSLGKEYALFLPKQFPSYLSTTIFTLDRANWTLTVDGHRLMATQGKLVSDWTFDVQNIRTGYLTLLLPKLYQGEGKVKLKVKEIDHLVSLWRNEQDCLGWTYDAPSSGHLIVRYPFDSKWRLTIDGQITEIQKGDNYFIQFPLSKGQHKILLEYWPQTMLRFWIALSVICVIFGLIAVISYGIASAFSLKQEETSPLQPYPERFLNV